MLFRSIVQKVFGSSNEVQEDDTTQWAVLSSDQMCIRDRHTIVTRRAMNGGQDLPIICKVYELSLIHI